MEFCIKQPTPKPLECIRFETEAEADLALKTALEWAEPGAIIYLCEKEGGKQCRVFGTKKSGSPVKSVLGVAAVVAALYFVGRKVLK
jgi:hypothetical protein